MASMFSLLDLDPPVNVYSAQYRYRNYTYWEVYGSTTVAEDVPALALKMEEALLSGRQVPFDTRVVQVEVKVLEEHLWDSPQP